MKVSRLPRPIYIIVRTAEMIISTVSRAINAAVFDGSTHQTTSARAFIEGKTDAKWAKRRDFIDRLFWFTPNHCEIAWIVEVEAAKKTLLKAGI